MRRERGYTLVEFALTLSIVMVLSSIVAAGSAFYRESAKTTNFLVHAAAVKSGMTKLSREGRGGSQPLAIDLARAAGLSKAELVDPALLLEESGEAFSTQRSGDLAGGGARAIRHPFGGFSVGKGATATALTAGRALSSVRVYDLSTGECQRAAAVAWDVFEVVAINGRAPLKDRFATPPRVALVAADISTACAAAEPAHVDFQFAP